MSKARAFWWATRIQVALWLMPAPYRPGCNRAIRLYWREARETFALLEKPACVGPTDE